MVRPAAVRAVRPSSSLVIGTSTGGTLAAQAARDPVLGPQIDGVVLISPNFGLKARGAFVLNLPLARYWLPMIAGRERCMTPKNEKHREYWTSCYPIVSLLPVAALVAEVPERLVRRLLAEDPALSSLEVRAAGLAEAFTELTRDPATLPEAA